MEQVINQQAESKVVVKIDPSRIMQIGMGFWASKVVLTAVKFNLFTRLAEKPLTAGDIKHRLNLKTTDRHVHDWLDAIVSLGLLERKGNGADAHYGNTPETELFLDKNKPSYMGGILEMANNRLYRFWNDLDEGLLTGAPQNESKHDNNMHFFEDLYKDPQKLQEFMDAMSGIQTGNFISLVKQFNFDDYKTMADVGGADGWLSIHVCLNHPSINCITYDLPPVEPLAQKKIQGFNLSDRIKVASGDFMKDDIPAAEIITMGNILHGLNEEAKQELVNKVYERLPDNGVFIAIENVIDEERNKNTFGLLMSLNMLIENGDAFDYTLSDFKRWASKAGFKKVEIITLTGPASAVIAYK